VFHVLLKLRLREGLSAALHKTHPVIGERPHFGRIILLLKLSSLRFDFSERLLVLPPEAFLTLSECQHPKQSGKEEETESFFHDSPLARGGDYSIKTWLRIEFVMSRRSRRSPSACVGGGASLR